MHKIPATLAILTRDSARTLEKALESAKEFDDIVVCDGYSTDETRAIAARFGARIIDQGRGFLDAKGRIFNYAGVRNQTLDAARHNWFFFLDSDEYCASDLIAAISRVVRERGEEGEGAFWIDRKYVIHDIVIDHAATYPNRQTRFFARRSVERFERLVHERIRLKPGVRAEVLDGTMLVPFEPDKTAIRRKWDYQIAVQAEKFPRMSLVRFFAEVYQAGKVSLLWTLRLVRNRLLYRGTHMPLTFEMERHRFHVKLLEALWGRVHVGNVRLVELPLAGDAARIARFIVAGGSAAAINLGILYVCTEWFHLWYLYSALLGFSVALVASFIFQKYWTFGDWRPDILFQFPVYATMQCMNLVINMVGLYVLVQLFGMWYMFAQTILLAGIAVWTYAIFRRVLFRATPPSAARARK